MDNFIFNLIMSVALLMLQNRSFDSLNSSFYKIFVKFFLQIACLRYFYNNHLIMFEFPVVDRAIIKDFKRNYLKSVIFQVQFEPNPEISSKRSEIAAIFIDTFPNIEETSKPGFSVSFSPNQTPIIQPSIEKSGYRLRSADDQEIISMDQQSVTYTIAGRKYVNFDSSKRILDDFRRIFKVANITGFTRVAIRKLNIIDFQIQEDSKIDLVSVSQLLLNPKLATDLSYFPQIEYINQNFNTVTYVKESEGLNLRYGFQQQPNAAFTGQILIDIDRYTRSKIAQENLDNKLEEINIEIFNVFNWALSDEAIDRLIK